MKKSSTLPGDPHKVEPHTDWSPQEKWIWNKICSGEIADFNASEEFKGYGDILEPSKPGDWPNTRILTQKFLETILLHEPYRDAISRKGVRIAGAWFKDEIDLSDATLTRNLCLEKSRIDADVNLHFFKTTHSLFLRGSIFNGNLNMESMQVDGELHMSNDAEFKGVVLRSAEIGGGLDMSGSTFEGTLNMNGMHVSAGLFMRGEAKFKDVDLRSAEIGGGLEMDGSTFEGTLNMNPMHVSGYLFMSGEAKFKDVVLRGAEIGGQLAMDGSTFEGTLDMNVMRVSGYLFMSGEAKFKDVVLRGAEIGGQLAMDGSTFEGTLNMNHMRVSGYLFMRGDAKFKDVDLGGAEIGGGLEMDGSTFEGTLAMDDMHVSGHLFMREDAKFMAVDLIDSVVEGGLDMDDSTFEGTLNMDRIQVSSRCSMSNSNFKKPVDLLFARLNSIFDISGSQFDSLNLTGTHIRGEFRLGSGMHLGTRWKGRKEMTLRNTTVDAIQDRKDAWPKELKLILDGFTYTRLGGYGVGTEPSMADRTVRWLKEWLEKQQHYSPQPYEQLAKVLRESGHNRKAQSILFSGKQRQRSNTPCPRKLGLFLVEIFVGYGYKNYRALGWVLLFTLIGFLIIQFGGSAQFQNLSKTIMDRMLYSFDILLPVIKLNESHYNEVTICGNIKYYFYFQKLMGYILGSFLIAGLSGITKK